MTILTITAVWLLYALSGVVDGAAIPPGGPSTTAPQRARSIRTAGRTLQPRRQSVSEFGSVGGPTPAKVTRRGSRAPGFGPPTTAATWPAAPTAAAKTAPNDVVVQHDVAKPYRGQISLTKADGPDFVEAVNTVAFFDLLNNYRTAGAKTPGRVFPDRPEFDAPDSLSPLATRYVQILRGFRDVYISSELADNLEALEAAAWLREPLPNRNTVPEKSALKLALQFHVEFSYQVLSTCKRLLILDGYLDADGGDPAGYNATNPTIYTLTRSRLEWVTSLKSRNVELSNVHSFILLLKRPNEKIGGMLF